ncbi:MAG: 3'(2'),5'-bisphosphate nucleotidase CysQ family protein [Terriglobales bacterium]
MEIASELITPCVHATEIDLVCDLARRAGKLALEMRAGVAVMEKAPGDVVTAADKAVSRLIVSELSERFPGDLIVSEEGDRQQASSNRTWLIDPIDGTDHYVKNSKQFSVMIGVLFEGYAGYGWVYKPVEDMLYFGGPGLGAFRQIGESIPEPLAAAEPLAGREYKRLIIGRRDARMRPWLERMPDVTLRQVGSMGVKVSWILEDRADLVAQMHGRMSVWDTCAPAAIALGAGLEVGSGNDLQPTLPFPKTFEPDTFVQSFPIVIGVPGTLKWARDFLLHEPAQ